jgi:hypothetical protein
MDPDRLGPNNAPKGDLRPSQDAPFWCASRTDFKAQAKTGTAKYQSDRHKKGGLEPPI